LVDVNFVKQGKVDLLALYHAPSLQHSDMTRV